MVVPDTSGRTFSGEMLVFRRWKDARQRLDPEAGAEIAPLHSFGNRVLRLYRARDTGALVIEKILLPGADQRALCRLGLDPMRVTAILPILASFIPAARTCASADPASLPSWRCVISCAEAD